MIRNQKTYGGEAAGAGRSLSHPFPQTWRERKHPGIPIPTTSPPWTVYGWLWNT